MGLLERFPSRIDAATASARPYDAVIVGGGISGAIIAKELSAAGKRVLILEAGVDDPYDSYLSRFYETAFKDNQSPYPLNDSAPMPRSSDAHKIAPGSPPDGSTYLVQTGPFGSDTTYTRVLGGTTMHWEAKTLRMLPEDFGLHTRHGQGRDWPIGYDDLEPFYREAENEIGVSADVESQSLHGIWFPDDYVYPMKGLPLSYLDKLVHAGIEGTDVELYGERYPLGVAPFAQGRNGIPNPAYTFKGEKGYRPVGAVTTDHVEEGGRCQGNNACVPICPVQAKYNAGKTLVKALGTGRVDVLPQAVASKVVIGSDGRVSGIEFKTYAAPGSGATGTGTAKGAIFVLSANAIENARLMLASGLASTSGLLGRNLMDHAYLLSWALMPEISGTMRGTVCTGGIPALRGGPFRRHQAAFGVDIHNDGWGWSVGSPLSDLLALVDDQNRFGRDLRQAMIDRLSRQLLLAFMVEVLPTPSNRVGVDPRYTDHLGNMKPVISYSVPEYTMRGVAYARQFAKLVFQRIGASDHTSYDPADYGYATYEGEGYAIRGGNHLAGTHVMGRDKATSVVDPDQRSWDHDNLFLVGGGSMPSVSTSNITLTIAALCFRSAKAMVRQLETAHAHRPA